MESAGQESIALAKKTTGKQKMVLKNGLWVKVQAEENVTPAPVSKGSVLGSRNEFGEKVRQVQPVYDTESKSLSGSRDDREFRSDSNDGYGRGRGRGRERSGERSGERR